MSSPFKINGVQSPPKRPIIQPSATSPFCTSPSQLQEVTLDPDATFPYAIGLHSPGGGPMRGRSVKEFEESLTNLRKENFNLKLRIYFLEERMGTNFNLDKENAIKKNIELKVEVESLRKEVTEKQDLLIQAVKAMELEEDEHKKASYEKDKSIVNLKNELESLQQKYDLFQDEMQSHGDHMDDEQKNMLFGQSYDLRKNDSSQDAIIKELENRINDLEMQLAKEKDNVTELDNLLQLTDTKNENISSLETDIRHKEDTIKKLVSELEDRGKRLTSYSVRINDLEEDLLEKKKDLDYMRKESKDRHNQIQELHLEVEELHKLLNEAQGLYELEKRKVEKHKTAIMQRNNKIVELENHLEKHKAKLITSEAKLESLQNEVKSKSDEPQAPPKGLLRTPNTSNTDVDSFLVRNAPATAELSPKKNVQRLKSPTNSPQRSVASFSANNEEENTSALVTYSPETSREGSFKLHQLQKELGKSKKHIFKLEQDQLRACKIIQSMLEMRKKNNKEIDELKDILMKKETQLEQFAAHVGKSGGKETKSLQAKITELNLTATVNPSADSETSMTDVNDDPKILLEQYKELTDSLEEQKQVLMMTLNESKSQMRALETKYDVLLDELKTKENRIVDLEFELLSLNQGISDSLCEKSDVGNEKPSNFFIKELEDKDKEIERLEHELRKRTCDLQSVVNKELWEKNREIEKLQKRFGDIIIGKDQEISTLEKNITSKDEQLDILKDRIFELNIDSTFHKENNECNLKNKADSINEDIKQLEEKLRACVEERDFFKQQVEELQYKIENVNSNELAVLKQEYKNLEEELIKCERLRADTTEVCTALSTRLEELAVFLDSLLKQKAVLGFLGYKENHKLRQLVSQSLDISRSLTMSISLNPNESLLQLSNISSFLNATNNTTYPDMDVLDEEEENAVLSVVPDAVTLTYQSHLYQASNMPENKVAEQAKIINVLRSQIVDLKKEVELRDNELNKLTQKSEELHASFKDSDCNNLTVSKVPSIIPHDLLKNDQELVDVLIAMTPDASDCKIETQQKIMENLLSDKHKLSQSADRSLNTSTTLKYRTDNQSESESWSEPDRIVSKARMGLYDENLKPNKKMLKITEVVSTEEDEHIVSRTSSRKSMLAENRQTIILLHEKLSELENALKEKDKQLVVIQLALKESEKLLVDERRRNDDAENQKLLLIEKIKDAELRLKLAESSKAEAEFQLDELQKTVREVKLSQKLLQDTMEIKNKETQNKINNLEMEKNQIIEALMIAEQTADEAKIDYDAAEKKLKLMQDEMLLIEKSIRREARHELEQAINTKELEYEVKIKNIEHKGESQVKRLNETVQELQEKYEAEYVKRCEVDKLMKTIKDLEHVQQIVKVAEDKIHILEDNEFALKERLRETELEYSERINSLLEELEKANLLYSETLLEKSRIMNDKSELDRQLKEFSDKENEFVKQVAEYKDDFANMKDGFQKQLAYLEQAKSKLEVRISELEQSNAVLRNKLIRLQTSDQILSKSAPNSPSRILDLFLSKTCPPGFKRQCSENSGYTSDDIPNESARRFALPCLDIVPIDIERHHSNSSPDLGIESDHGRFSSLEANVNITRPCLKTLELTESMSNLLSVDHMDSSSCNNDLCCKKTKEIVNENNDLRKRLLRTRRALEETVSQLKIANQRKKQVEKTICKQIHKTSQVLRKAKANLDSGSESEIKK